MVFVGKGHPEKTTVAFGWDSSNLNAQFICSMNVGVSPFWKSSMSLGYVSLCRTEHSVRLARKFVFLRLSGQGRIGAGSGKHNIRKFLHFAKN